VTLSDITRKQVLSTQRIDENENLTYLQQQINAMASNPTVDMMIAAGSEDGTLRMLDFSTNKTSHLISEAHKDAISSLCFDTSGIYIYTGSHDGTIKSWDMRNLRDCTSLTNSTT